MRQARKIKTVNISFAFVKGIYKSLKDVVLTMCGLIDIYPIVKLGYEGWKLRIDTIMGFIEDYIELQSSENFDTLGWPRIIHEANKYYWGTLGNTVIDTIETVFNEKYVNVSSEERAENIGYAVGVLAVLIGSYVESKKTKVNTNGKYNWRIGTEEDAKFLGKGAVGDFSGLEGSSIEDILGRIPEDATRRDLIPIEGKVTEGFEYTWKENGTSFHVRIHGADPSAPAGSNAANGWVVRVEKGNKYLDPVSMQYQPRGTGNINSPNYNETIANQTHIPIKNPD